MEVGTDLNTYFQTECLCCVWLTVALGLVECQLTLNAGAEVVPEHVELLGELLQLRAALVHLCAERGGDGSGLRVNARSIDSAILSHLGHLLLHHAVHPLKENVQSGLLQQELLELSAD